MVFVRINGLTIWDVSAYHAHAGYAGSDDALLLIGKLRYVMLDVGHGMATDDGHAVIGFLPNVDRLIAYRLQVGVGEFMVLLLGFLQAQHVGLIALQPIQDMR